MDTKALFNIGYGLYVLSAKEGEKDSGCIVNTVMQVTSDPLAVVVAVNRSNYTNGMIARTGVFDVSVLSEDAAHGQRSARAGRHIRQRGARMPRDRRRGAVHAHAVLRRGY